MFVSLPKSSAEATKLREKLAEKYGFELGFFDPLDALRQFEAITAGVDPDAGSVVLIWKQSVRIGFYRSDEADRFLTDLAKHLRTKNQFGFNLFLKFNFFDRELAKFSRKGDPRFGTGGRDSLQTVRWLALDVDCGSKTTNAGDVSSYPTRDEMIEILEIAGCASDDDHLQSSQSRFARLLAA